MKEEVFSIENSSKSFLWSIFLPQILSLVLVIVFSSFYKTLEELSGSILYLITMMLVAQAGFAIIAGMFAKKHKLKPINLAKESFKKLSFRNIIICVLISVIAIAGLVNFVGIFDIIWAKIGYSVSGSYLPNSNFGWFILDVLLSCIIPAIMEEILFRGIIFNGLKKLGFWFGAIISAVMFMLVHLSLGSLVYPIIMGIVFCLVYQKTQNIIYPIIIHFCNNFFVKLIEYFNVITSNNFGTIEMTAWWHFVLVIIGAIVAVTLIYFIIKYLIKNKQEIVIKNRANNLEENSKTEEIEEQEKQNINLKVEDLQADTDKILAKRRNNIYLYGSLAIGFVFWIIMVVLSII